MKCTMPMKITFEYKRHRFSENSIYINLKNVARNAKLNVYIVITIISRILYEKPPTSLYYREYVSIRNSPIIEHSIQNEFKNCY